MSFLAIAMKEVGRTGLLVREEHPFEVVGVEVLFVEHLGKIEVYMH